MNARSSGRWIVAVVVMTACGCGFETRHLPGPHGDAAVADTGLPAPQDAMVVQDDGALVAAAPDATDAGPVPAEDATPSP